MSASTFISPLHRLVLAHIIRGHSKDEIARLTGWQGNFVQRCIAELTSYKNDGLVLLHALRALPHADKTNLHALANTPHGRTEDPVHRKILSHAYTHFGPGKLAKIKSPFALVEQRTPTWKELCVAIAQAKTWGLSGREITRIYGGDANQLRGIWDYHGIWLQRTSPLATALNYVDSCMGKAEEEWLASIPLAVQTTKRRNARISEEEFLTVRVSAKGRKLSAEQVAVDLGMSIRRPNRIFSRIAASTGIPAHHILIPVIFYIRSR